MTTLSPQEYIAYLLAHKGALIAPWIAGCVVDLYAAGIYTGMVVRYFTRSDVPRDTSKTRLLVILVAVLSTYKSAAALYILFLASVILSGDQTRLAVASLTNGVLVTSPLTTQFVDLAVQSYYAALLWQIFRLDGGQRFHPLLRWGLFAGIFTLTVVGVTMACLAVAEMLSLRFIRAPEYLATQLAAGFFCDAFISVGTIYCLLKSNNYSAKNRSTFNKIARLIALSASIPALCALLNVSIVAANVFYNRWHVFFDFALSKSFAISFMWTVEVRRDMRHAETLERTSDVGQGRPNLTSHQLSQNFFDSRFAATVQITPLPQSTIELGNQRRRTRDRLQEMNSISGSGHSAHGNFLDMKG